MKVEKLVQTLVMAERYEAVGPICRLAIPVYEEQKNYRVSQSRKNSFFQEKALHVFSFTVSFICLDF